MSLPSVSKSFIPEWKTSPERILPIRIARISALQGESSCVCWPGSWWWEGSVGGKSLRLCLVSAMTAPAQSLALMSLSPQRSSWTNCFLESGSCKKKKIPLKFRCSRLRWNGLCLPSPLYDSSFHATHTLELSGTCAIHYGTPVLHHNASANQNQDSSSLYKHWKRIV